MSPLLYHKELQHSFTSTYIRKGKEKIFCTSFWLSTLYPHSAHAVSWEHPLPAFTKETCACSTTSAERCRPFLAKPHLFSSRETHQKFSRNLPGSTVKSYFSYCCRYMVLTGTISHHFLFQLSSAELEQLLPLCSAHHIVKLSIAVQREGGL